MARWFTNFPIIMAPSAAWVAAVIANGGTVSAGRQNLVNNLITDLQVDGVFAKLDALFLYAGENQPSGLTDIVNLILATAVNSPTFTTDRGFTGNGTSSYIDSNFNAATASNPKFTRNSACFFVWSNTTGTDAGGIAGTAVSAGTQLVPRYTDNNCYWNLNISTGSSESFTVGAGNTGLYLLNRTGPLFGDETCDLNGVQVDVGTSGGGASAPVANENFVSLRHTGFSTRQCCCFGFGGALTATDRGNIYNRLRTYMTAVGVP